nr:MAG TPA: hypothetical protein [Caudoviricetes sp.]
MRGSAKRRASFLSGGKGRCRRTMVDCLTSWEMMVHALT